MPTGNIPHTMNPSRYRPDIDGLRAVAVLSVLFYHLGVETFSGGFVGVDIFFVISGFLITRLIHDAVNRGTFSFSDFYLRRARRLFPALFFTLLVTFAIASWIFLPHHLERFGGALIHSILSVSNFYFWGEAGYFDADASLKPLLHTWSLSVEEQFYFVWPLTLFLLITRLNKRAAPLFIVAAGLISFYMSTRWVETDPAGAFFLAPFRVFEFAFGAIMVWMIHHRPRNPMIDEALFLSGLGLIAYPIFTYTSKTAFPGFNALMPCLGTALLIYSGTAKYSGQLLSNRLTVGIGLISYSLYLIHWPMIVFYKYYFERSVLGPVSITAITMASIMGAMLMYFFIEKPFRYGKSKHSMRRLSAPAFGFACALSSLFLVLPATHIWAKNGWEWRFPSDIIRTVGNPTEKMQASWKFIDTENPVATREYNNASSKKILVVGDSHSKDIFNSLFLNGSAIPSTEVRRMPLNDSCLYLFSGQAPPRSHIERQINLCRQQAEELLTSSLYRNADTIILSSRWSRTSIGWLPDFIARLRQDNPGKILIFGRTAEFQSVPDLIIRHGLRGDIESFVAARRDKALDQINRLLEQMALELNVDYIDKVSFICSEDRTRCDVVDREGNLLYYDYGHWTLEGAKYFGRKMIESGYFRNLVGLRIAGTGGFDTVPANPDISR